MMNKFFVMKNKVIGVDLRCLPRDGSAGAGVAHASRALCEALTSNVERRTSNVDMRFYVPEGADWQVGDVVKLKDATGGSLRKAFKDKPCDLLFVPGGSIAPAVNMPTIPWVHDLIIFEHPEWFNQPWWQRRMTTYLFSKGLRRAPAILAVSEYTKSQIVKLLKIDPEKIVVTYEGGDSTLRVNNKEQTTTLYELRGSRLINNKVGAKEFCERELGLGRGFVLCLGTVEPRKNVGMLIRAWKKARQKSAQAPDLVVAGTNGWKFEDVEAQIKSLNATEDQFFHRYRSVTEEQKRILLLAADLVVVPSLDEGFGLVALEAMQAGTPIAVSNRGALPEIVSTAGMIIDPQDEDAWATALLTCVEDERACVLRSEMGLKRAQEFSWEKTAETVIKLLATSY